MAELEVRVHLGLAPGRHASVTSFRLLGWYKPLDLGDEVTTIEPVVFAGAHHESRGRPNAQMLRD